MTWTKLGDEFSDEARDLTDAEFRTHVEALIWSNRRGLDLTVPKRDLKRFAESPDAEEAICGLIAADWWQDRGGCWFIGERFGEWQLERSVVDKRREMATARQQRRRKHLAGDHSSCSLDNCGPVTRDRLRDNTRDPGRVGSGSPPSPLLQAKDQNQDQSQSRAGDGVDGDPSHAVAAPVQTGFATNSQNRGVRHDSETMADDAQGFSIHDAGSTTTGTTRATTVRAPIDRLAS